MKLRERLRYYERALVRHDRNVSAPSEKGAEWYRDEVYSTSAAYQGDYRGSFYLPVWKTIVARLRTANVGSILDLGCGPGQFAALLREEGFERYVGIDFSATAIALARERCPEFTFCVADLNAFEFQTLPRSDAVVATEVLEHIKQDLDVLRRLPPGTLFVGSVPAFDWESHVRYFPTRQDVVQ